jgi:small multidrug resistance pump
MRYLVALAAALVLNACANLLMKVGMKDVAAGGGVLRDGLAGVVRTIVSSWPLLIGLGCFALNAAFYMYALQSRALKISVAYPIMVGGGFALIAVAARFHPALAERLNAAQVAGVVLVFAGILLIASQMDATADVRQ